MALVADSDELDLTGGRVSLMTLHVAKGSSSTPSS